MKHAIALVLALTLNAAANLMMKFGVRRLGEPGLSLDKGLVPAAAAVVTNGVLVAGLVCFAANVLLYTYSLSGFKISAAYPIMVGGGFAVIAVVAWRFLDESMTPLQWVGVTVILAGVWLVARDMNTVAGK